MKTIELDDILDFLKQEYSERNTITFAIKELMLCKINGVKVALYIQEILTQHLDTLVYIDFNNLCDIYYPALTGVWNSPQEFMPCLIEWDNEKYKTFLEWIDGTIIEKRESIKNGERNLSDICNSDKEVFSHNLGVFMSEEHVNKRGILDNQFISFTQKSLLVILLQIVDLVEKQSTLQPVNKFVLYVRNESGKEIEVGLIDINAIKKLKVLMLPSFTLQPPKTWTVKVIVDQSHVIEGHLSKGPLFNDSALSMIIKMLTDESAFEDSINNRYYNMIFDKSRTDCVPKHTQLFNKRGNLTQEEITVLDMLLNKLCEFTKAHPNSFKDNAVTAWDVCNGEYRVTITENK